MQFKPEISILNIPARNIGVCILLCLPAMLITPSALGQDNSWTAGDGDWFVNTNWSLTSVPTSSNGVYINNGATVTIDTDGARAGGTVILGENNGDSGLLEIDGAGDTWAANTTILIAGYAGSGTVNITNASQIETRDLYVGYQSTGNGALTVDGAGTTLTNTDSRMFIGRIGTGSLTISDGALVDHSGDRVDLGNGAGASGTLHIGAGGAPGILSAATIRGGIGSATVNFNHTAEPHYFTDDGSSGGAAMVIYGSTEVNQIGTGTTVLTANNTYTGSTTVNAGTLRVTGSIASSATTVNAGGTLGGTGTTGDVTVNGGTLAPGTSAGTLDTGTLVFNSASTLDMELDTAGVVGGGTNDLIDVTGDLTLDGTLAVTDLGGLGVGTYTLISYTGTLTDNGLDLPVPPAGLNFALNSGGGTVTLEVDISTHDLNYAAGANGSLTGTTSQTVDYGDDGTAVTAVADANYVFAQWSDASTDNPRTDTNVTADITVTAQFAPITYNLLYSAGANGSLTGTTSQTVDHSDDGTAVTAVPDAGYEFVQWSDASTDNPRTDTNVGSDITVTAQFSIADIDIPIPLIIDGVFSGNGDVLRNLILGGNATISNAILDDILEIDPAAQFGPDVCFSEPGAIPDGFDTRRLFQTMPANDNDDLQYYLLDHAVVCDTAPLLEDIVLMDALQDAGIHVEYDADTGELLLSLPEARARLLPVQLLNTEPGAAPGIVQGGDGTLEIVTGTGITIIVQPRLQDEAAFAALFASSNLALGFDSNGNIILEQPGAATEYIVARPVLPVLLVSPDAANGIFESDLVPGSPPAATIVATLSDDETVSQLLVSWPAHWFELQEYLAGFDGVDAVIIDQYGMISVSMNGETVRLRADFTVTRGVESPNGAADMIVPAGDLNGDSIEDFRVQYANGDSQILLVIP